MKKNLLILLLVILAIATPKESVASSVFSNLKSKYSLVQHHAEYGGWYFLSYQKNNQTLYGFADAKGNIVASGASQYRLHKGYIELYQLDLEQKARHDKWIQDMRQYNVNYQNYQRVEAEHKNKLNVYRANRDAADREAANRQAQAKALAEKRAQQRVDAYQRQIAQQSQANSGNSAAALGAAIGNLLAVATQKKEIQAIWNSELSSVPSLDSYKSQVRGERGLSVEPSKPYNPTPSKPSEPDSGYYWGRYLLQQPSPYDYVDYDAISEIDNYANVSKNGKYGVINSELKEFVPCIYDSKVLSKKLDKDRFLISLNGKQGIIDHKANTIIEPIYKSITQKGNLYNVTKDGKYGLYSTNGSVVIPCEYNKISVIAGDMYHVEKDMKHGLLTSSGATIMPCEFDAINPSNGYFICRKNGMFGIYTSTYDELYPCQYQDVVFNTVNKRLVLITKIKGLYGIVDFKSGESLLPNNYTKTEVLKCDNGVDYYRVSQNNKFGLYTQNGTIILPCEFTDIKFTKIENNPYYSRVIEVKKDKYVGLYSMDGVQIIDPTKYNSYKFDGTYYQVTNGGLLGLCNIFGDAIAECQYTKLIYNNKLKGLIANRDKKWGVLDMLGREQFPFVSASRFEFNDSPSNHFSIYDSSLQKWGAIDFDGNTIVPMSNKKRSALPAKVAKYCKKVDIKPIKDARMSQLELSMNDLDLMTMSTQLQHKKFSYYAQHYVELIINEWQKRGEFERLDEWQKRVNNETRRQKIYELTKRAESSYIDKMSKSLTLDTTKIIGSYDPDNETYRLSTNYSLNDILVKVSANDAQEFKSLFTSLSKQATFFVENDRLSLAEYTFKMPNGNSYKYSNKASLTHTIAQVDYNFETITIGSSNSSTAGGKQTISTKTFSYGTSDVDYNIPVTDIKQDKTFAVIIANELYENEKHVEFAYNDGQIFRDYCIKTLGIPTSNVHFKANATLNNMRFAINWMKDVAKAYNGEASFIVYYAGHGMPDDNTKDAYLLPTDGSSADVSSGYKLSEFYESIGSASTKETIVLLDACFSGSQRAGEVMASARGVAIKPKVSEPKGNMIIFSAASDVETAYPYREKSHGLFTYFLLKNLQDTKGNTNMGSLSDYVSNSVSKTSIVANKKSQTPTLSPSTNMNETWRSVKLLK